MTADQYLRELSDALTTLDLEAIEVMAGACHAAFESGRTVFCLGNGGSAATASHLATDLSKLTILPGCPRRLRALALTDSVPAITAAANDLSYTDVFVEQLRTFLDARDVVIGISASGASPNVLRALEYANASDAVTLGVTGAGGTALARIARHTVMIPSDNVQRIEDVSTVIVHLLCLLTRSRMARRELGRSGEDYAGAAVAPSVVSPL